MLRACCRITLLAGPLLDGESRDSSSTPLAHLRVIVHPIYRAPRNPVLRTEVPGTWYSSVPSPQYY